MNTKPIDVLDHAIGCAIASSANKWPHAKPGEIIERLSEHDRQILKNLTSEDTQKMRGLK